ncbi:MotA/TolQ/ExbB proton channel family protein [Ectothiorhodospiraceae bacterium WFHF3C12]|nr:MotA/TolQ/ExbB proton channel family protein [Ectothiorhodospiraceae bacterium WFHF3C12]
MLNDAMAPLQTLTALVGAGGVVVVLLLGASLVVVTIVILKIWQFRAARVGDAASARRAADLYASGDAAGALSLLQVSHAPAATILHHVITASRQARPPAQVQDQAARLAADSLERLRAYLKPLEVIATLAPLLGLFGTVLGMIEAFRALELAGNQVSPSLLSGGIWKALVTTAVGLAVAMPAVVFLSWFERRVDREAHEIEITVSRVLTADPQQAGSAAATNRHDPSGAITVQD